MSDDSTAGGMVAAERERRLERYEAFAAGVREDYGSAVRQMEGGVDGRPACAGPREDGDVPPALCVQVNPGRDS